jgi:putative hydrolase of the HAD superfamily
MHIFNQTNTAKLFSSYFIKDYYSHILGLRKPNVDAYIKVLDEQHLQASETLFIDDTLKNIEGAKQAGLLTLLLLPSMDLETEVSHFLQQYI